MATSTIPYVFESLTKIEELGKIDNLSITPSKTGCVYHFIFDNAAVDNPFQNTSGHGFLFVNTGTPAGAPKYGLQIIFSNGGIKDRSLVYGSYDTWHTIH